MCPLHASKKGATEQQGGRWEGKSNVTHTSGKRGVVMCSDRSVSAMLGDAIGMLGTAGREGEGGIDVK